MKKLASLLCMLSLILIAVPQAAAAKKHQVAIVIDDFGNNMKGTSQILSLPIPLTIAVMPFLPSSRQDAIMAHQKGHEVIIHMPMEPIRGKKSWLGPNAITTDLSDEEIRKRLEMAIKQIPYAIGMNNHMGSKATADERVMRIVLSVCKEYGLFYLDSKTNPNSVVKKMARKLDVPVIENEMFFDDVYTSSHVTKQMGRLLQKVEEDKTSIIIGHVGPPGEITASVIQTHIPQLKKAGEIIFVSDLLAPRPIFFP